MTFDQVSDTRSRAAVANHPLHPMLVPLPIAMLATAAATDLLYLGTRDRNWAKSSRWLLRAGVMTAGIAAPFGLTDFLTIPEARRHAAGWIHLGGNAAVLALSSINLALRGKRADKPIFPLGVALSAGTAGLLLVTGWFGGELAYRHGVGVSIKDAGQVSLEPSLLDSARRRARRSRAIEGGVGMPVMEPGSAGTESPDLVALRELPQVDE